MTLPEKSPDFVFGDKLVCCPSDTGRYTFLHTRRQRFFSVEDVKQQQIVKCVQDKQPLSVGSLVVFFTKTLPMYRISELTPNPIGRVYSVIHYHKNMMSVLDIQTGDYYTLATYEAESIAYRLFNHNEELPAERKQTISTNLNKLLETKNTIDLSSNEKELSVSMYDTHGDLIVSVCANKNNNPEFINEILSTVLKYTQ